MFGGKKEDFLQVTIDQPCEPTADQCTDTRLHPILGSKYH